MSIYRFENRSKVFTSLTVFSGSCYAALAIVSSNIFGLDLFSCGLTKYELRKLTKIKIINCVLMENIPQLMLQAAVYSSGEFSQSTLFATVSSLLSVFAASLSYFVDQKNKDDDMLAIHHYLELQCDRNASSGSATTLPIQTKEVKGNVITEDERELIKLYRGWRLKLGRSLTAFWHLPDKTIEIGNTVLTANGAVTHIVHLMNKHVMKGYVKELLGNRPDGSVSALEIARRFYSVHRLEISEIFRSHFGLDDAFNVVFYDQEEAGSPRGSRITAVYSGNDYLVELRATTSRVSVQDKESLLQTALNVFFGDNRNGDFQDKKQQLMQLAADFEDRFQREQNVNAVDDEGKMIEMVEYPTSPMSVDLSGSAGNSGLMNIGDLNESKKGIIAASIPITSFRRATNTITLQKTESYSKTSSDDVM